MSLKMIYFDSYDTHDMTAQNVRSAQMYKVKS